ncbi:MAG: hypothetical protein Q4E05_05230 [Pseudoclavibacter sp.]|nr:hypothetical protein [Pseudoclavibacter sp.]
MGPEDGAVGPLDGEDRFRRVRRGGPLAQAAAAPLAARRPEADRLSHWLRGPRPFAIALVGGLGCGTTRLLDELVERAGRIGRRGRGPAWLAGRLPAGADTPPSALAAVRRPRCIVVDEADRRPGRLRSLLPVLRDSASAQAPVRLVLHLRAAGPARPELLRGAGERAVRLLEDEPLVLSLARAPLSVVERQRLLRGALAAFAAGAAGARDGRAPRAGQGLGARPLHLVIAPGRRAAGRAAPTDPESALRALMAWADPEAAAAGAESALLRAVACASLTDAAGSAEAVELLRSATGRAPLRAEGLDERVRRLFPAGRGELHWGDPAPRSLALRLANTLRERSELLARALDPRRPTSLLLRPLARCADLLLLDRDPDHPWLEPLAAALPDLSRLAAEEALRPGPARLAEHLACLLAAAADRLPEAALGAARQALHATAGAPLGPALTPLLLVLERDPAPPSSPRGRREARGRDARRARRREDPAPERALEWMARGRPERARLLLHAQLAAPSAPDGDPRELSRRAGLHQLLARAYALSGRAEEAVEQLRREIALRRIADRADGIGCSHFLCEALAELAGILAALGRRDEASRALERAVEATALLARRGDPQARRELPRLLRLRAASKGAREEGAAEPSPPRPLRRGELPRAGSGGARGIRPASPAATG